MAEGVVCAHDLVVKLCTQRSAQAEIMVCAREWWAPCALHSGGDGNGTDYGNGGAGGGFTRVEFRLKLTQLHSHARHTLCRCGGGDATSAAGACS